MRNRCIFIFLVDTGEVWGNWFAEDTALVADGTGRICILVCRLQVQSALGRTAAWQVRFLGSLPGLVLAEGHHLTRPV